MFRLGRALVCFVIVVACLPVRAANRQFRPVDLRCEYRRNPLGIDAPRPRLSWILEPTDPRARGEMQTAYQILVASTPEKLSRQQGDLWDSGKVQSGDTIATAYSGAPLASRARCYWKVRIWDSKGQVSAWSAVSFWTMGLLKLADWQAHWITASRWFVPPTLRPKGFVTSPSNSSDMYAWADVDLGAPFPIDSVQLYSPEAASFPVRFKIESSTTQDFSRAQMIADWTTRDYVGWGMAPRLSPALAYVRVT